MPQSQDIDLFQMPIEAVASYWLALKKLLGGSKNFKPLVQEAEYAGDVYTRHLLNISFGGLENEVIRTLALAKSGVVLQSFTRGMDLIRICLLDMLSVENPHRTLAKMMSQYVEPPAPPTKVFKYAQVLLRQKVENASAAQHFNVTPRLPEDRLVTVLLFYNLLVRHKDKMICQEYMPYIESRFFRDGLALIIDGFEEPFVRRWLREHRTVYLKDMSIKMDMSLELCLGIKNRLEYENLVLVAQSFF